MSKLFPKSANRLPLQIVIFLVLFGGVATAGVTYYMTPKYTRVGYAPVQPVPFSHALHAGQLGLDCRFCHSNVEKSGHSNVPTSQTCMNCHNQVLKDDPKLALVRESAATGKPIAWVQLHKTPDFVYFNHSVHVNRGISCVHCHGPVNKMDEVRHSKSLGMAFCLECHRDPAAKIRPVDQVYNLDWQAPEGFAKKEGAKLVKDWNVHPGESCSVCHR